MYKTKIYNIFKFAKFNRKINVAKVKKLANNLSQYGQIQPVVVDLNNYIIDGQHRVKACEMLGIDVLYVVSENNINSEIVQVVNNNNTNWDVNNYADSGEVNGDINYIQYKEFRNKYGFLHDVALRLLCIDTYKKTTSIDFKNGKFKVTSYEKGLELAEYIKEISAYNKLLKKREFISAIIELQKDTNFDLQKLKLQIAKYSNYIKPYSNTESCKQNLIFDVYNRSNRNKYILELS